MATAVIMPRQGQSVESCILTKWFKKRGENVKKGEVLFSYETDKASFEEEAALDGVLLDVFFKEDDDIPCLTNVAVIGNVGEATETFRPSGASTAAGAAPESAPSPSSTPTAAATSTTTPAAKNFSAPATSAPAAPAVAASGSAVVLSAPAPAPVGYKRTADSPEFDLIVLGGGPGGYNAAERAGEAGLKVCLIEKENLGGVCLNWGCIPTKTLLNSAKYVEMAKEAKKYGVTLSDPTFNYDDILKRKNKVITKLVGGVGLKMKHGKVEVIKEVGVIESRDASSVTVKAGDRLVKGAFLLIAAGAEAAVPPIPGLERDKILTNREILNLSYVPKKLTVIGGGVIGLEFASFFTTLGTKVTIIEMMSEILPGIDNEISESLRKEYEKKGVDFLLNCKVVKLSGKTAVTYEKDGKECVIEGDEILLSIGRRPNTKGIGLEKIGVALTERGAVKTDMVLRTNLTNVYACGDINGVSLLAHTAYREGEVAVNHILGKKDIMRYNAIPGVVYTNPEVASVGLTEDEAKKTNTPYTLRKLPMAYAGRFLAENEGKDGYCKILVGKYNEVLGVHMIGSHCSEMIFGAVMMIETEMTVDSVKEMVFPHPTVSEIIRETAFKF